MKKAVCSLLAIFAVLLSSCSGKEGEKTGEFSKGDIKLTLGDQTFYFGQDAKPLLDFLGVPDDTEEILSCYYEGYDKTFKYEKVHVTSYPREGKDILDEALFYDATYSFKGGVRVGSTKDDVIKSYGDKFFMDGELMVYNETNNKSDIESPRLSFTLKDDKVTTVYFDSNSYFQD